MALGLSKVDAVKEASRYRASFTPRWENAKLYSKGFKAFLEFYRRNRGLYAAING